MHLKLRPGTLADAEAIAGLIASFQSDITDHPDGAGAEGYLTSVSAEAERGYLASSRYAFTVAESGGQMLGFIAMRDTTHLFHLFVARGYQRQGVAKRLWEQAKADAMAAPGALCFTVNASLGSVAVYQAFGFTPLGPARSVHGISFVPMQLDIMPP